MQFFPSRNKCRFLSSSLLLLLPGIWMLVIPGRLPGFPSSKELCVLEGWLASWLLFHAGVFGAMLFR